MTTATLAARTQTDKPNYWAWWRYLNNVWEAPPDIDKAYMISFCSALVLDADDGKACYPTNATLMRRLGKSRSWVQRYRKHSVQCGLMRPVTPARNVKRVTVLEISLPGEGVSPDTLMASPQTPITNNYPSDTRISKGVSPDTLTLVPAINNPRTSQGVSTDTLPSVQADSRSESSNDSDSFEYVPKVYRPPAIPAPDPADDPWHTTPEEAAANTARLAAEYDARHAND